MNPIKPLSLSNANVNVFLEKYGTPLQIFDLHSVRSSVREFNELFSFCSGHYYSTKTNPEAGIIDTVASEGMKFEVASHNEVTYLVSRGIQPENIISTQPVKTVMDVQNMYSIGIRVFTFDALSELQKLVEHAPEATYLLRIMPGHSASLYDYKGKFGATDGETRAILDYAAQNHARVGGLSFHVGSQSMAIDPWESTLSYVRQIFGDYYDRIPTLRTVNIGSGFPIQYGFDTQVPSLEQIAGVVRHHKEQMPEDVAFISEPGRVLVAESSVIITSVTDVIQRDNATWVYIDTNAYNGLIEVIESGGSFQYKIEAENPRTHETRPYYVAGNTLDPDDIIAKDLQLPADLKAGDLLIIRDTGAYTTTFHGNYHHYDKVNIEYIDSEYDHNVRVGLSAMASHGVMAQRDIEEGELIFTVTGYFSDDRTRTSFQVDENRHVEPAILGAFLNHSCDPNAGLQTNDNGYLNVVARRHIPHGTEVIVDYAMFEYELGEMSTITCACGTDLCRHHITGYKELPAHTRDAYTGYVATYLLTMAEQ